MRWIAQCTAEHRRATTGGVSVINNKYWNSSHHMAFGKSLETIQRIRAPSAASH